MTEPTTATKSWRELIRVHPAAELFPLLSEPELTELIEDIKEHGLTSPVTTWVDEDGTEWLLDGRNRLDAMAAAGYRFKLHGQVVGLGAGDVKRREPERFKIFPQKGHHKWSLAHVHHYFGADPYAYVASANIRRRHLTQDQKRELIGKLLKANPGRSDRATAKIANADHKTVAAVRAEGEASGEIPHMDPTDRIDAGGRKRARKTANTAEKVATAELVGEQVEVLAPKDQPQPAAKSESATAATSWWKPIAERDDIKAILSACELLTPKDREYLRIALIECSEMRAIALAPRIELDDMPPKQRAWVMASVLREEAKTCSEHLSKLKTFLAEHGEELDPEIIDELTEALGNVAGMFGEAANQ